MNKIGEQKVDTRPETNYLGIREQMPMSSFGDRIGPLFDQLAAWFASQGLTRSGPPFLRYHVINMPGNMDIEVGYPVAEPLPGDDQVKPGKLPAGQYASLIYQGGGYEANKVLIEWAEASGVRWDRWDDPAGDAFRARYESFLTDPKIEPDILKWDIEVAIKLAED